MGHRVVSDPTLFDGACRISESFPDGKDGRYLEGLLFLVRYGIYGIVHHYPSDALNAKLVSALVIELA